MSGLLAIDLWSPHHGLSVGMVIVTAFLLGVVHGVAPDEHTWPITFSYALGSFSARRMAIDGMGHQCGPSTSPPAI